MNKVKKGGVIFWYTSVYNQNFNTLKISLERIDSLSDGGQIREKFLQQT